MITIGQWTQDGTGLSGVLWHDDDTSGRAVYVGGRRAGNLGGWDHAHAGHILSQPDTYRTVEGTIIAGSGLDVGPDPKTGYAKQLSPIQYNLHAFIAHSILTSNTLRLSFTSIICTIVDP
ncbi:hypothetical protein BC938DRAFT_474340 [Jimgerdemannia flammicorona]|uniref:Uncharacterized protein n=1 Tax=Jimgerdemannia flammicorona TaxID=994334 RepID=A0A433QSK9_9FUNG|nr:hypothetical protein BC938DRAFT_474340 [Jimgerdemannia flammicorona]